MTALYYCFYAIPDGKPLRTFPGIALWGISAARLSWPTPFMHRLVGQALMVGAIGRCIRALVAGMKAENALGQKVFSINQNYSWGQDIQAAIEQSATENGFTVVDKVLHDVNKIQDFSPYVARIAASRADTVFTGNCSNSAISA